MEQLYWRQPLWILLALFPLLIMLWQQVKQRHSLGQYADAKLLPWIIVPDLQKRSRVQLVSQILIWLLLGIAAAGPRLLLFAPQNLLPPKGAAVIVIDHSRSMLANDVSPDRLQQADNVVTQWTQDIGQLKLGLVIFAGASHIVLPVTSDQRALHETASLLNEIQLPTYGSAIVESLRQAKSLLANQAGARAIIMLTDGDVPEASFKQLGQITAELQKDNITLHLLGVGTPSPVPLTDGSGHWLQYHGKPVLTRLNETELQALAKSKNTFYSRLNPSTDNKLLNVWNPEPARINKQHYNQVLWHELFPWFLIPALILNLINYLPKLRLPLSTARFLTATIIIAWLIQPSPAQASDAGVLQQAYTSWLNHDYTAAAKYYARVDGYAARMGEGASCFRDEQIECAITAFSRAAWEATTDTQRGQAAFNLGNSYFKQGDFKSAITLYQDALRYQPQEATYQNNLDISEEIQRNIERYLQQKDTLNTAAQHGGDQKEIDIDNRRISDFNITLGDNPKNKQLKKSHRIKLTEEQLAQYMQANLRFVRISSGHAEHKIRQHDWSRFSNENPVAARKIEYWQRLFELEEGIPAHPQKPETLPGVQPW